MRFPNQPNATHRLLLSLIYCQEGTESGGVPKSEGRRAMTSLRNSRQGPVPTVLEVGLWKWQNACIKWEKGFLADKTREKWIRLCSDYCIIKKNSSGVIWLFQALAQQCVDADSRGPLDAAVNRGSLHSLLRRKREEASDRCGIACASHATCTHGSPLRKAVTPR